MTRIVILAGGERYKVAYDDERGVHTDAGCHPWDECEAFLVALSDGRVVSIPI